MSLVPTRFGAFCAFILLVLLFLEFAFSLFFARATAAAAAVANVLPAAALAAGLLLVITEAASRVTVLRSVPGRRMLAILVGLVQVVMAAGRGPILR